MSETSYLRSELGISGEPTTSIVNLTSKLHNVIVTCTLIDSKLLATYACYLQYYHILKIKSDLIRLSARLQLNVCPGYFNGSKLGL